MGNLQTYSLSQRVKGSKPFRSGYPWEGFLTSPPLSMPTNDYKWKRFWCPRSGRINLADRGYLCDPDGEWGRAHNPDLVSLEAIAEIPCLVLLGEPGIGKSHELKNLKAHTEANSRRVLELNLRSCTNLKEELFKDEIFIDWLGSNYHLCLFLDSLDEGLLSNPTLAAALIDEIKKPKYWNHVNRLHLRLACRTFVFPKILEEGLKEIWQEANYEAYELAPLRRVDVCEAAKAEDFSFDDFTKEIEDKDIVPLAIKPITLIFLLNTYRRHSHFPSNQRLCELYLGGCRVLCEENNESRRGSNRTGNLDTEQRLIVAARIAAITIFTNRFAIWTDIDQGDIPDEHIFLQKLCFDCEKANGTKVEVTKEAIKEVLDTGLFSSRGLCRMGWSHQTYAEFLAAWYLQQHETSLTQIRGLIFSSEGLGKKLIPQLHETAAWLAGMRSDVLREIISTDPDVLLRADVPTDVEIRNSIVSNLLTQYEEGNLFDRGTNDYRNYAKLKHPRLVEQLRPYICDSTKKIAARDLAICIAEVCEVSELQKELVNLALDPLQSIYLRVSAAKSICSIGDADSRLKMKHLAIKQLPEDEEDRLKGYALKAVWSDHLTATELFNALPRPKKKNFIGIYQLFLRYELPSKLQPSDLGVALNWLEGQGLRCFGHPFKELGNIILFKAWENFDFPGVAEDFTQVALVQWKEHERIITHDHKLQKRLAESLLRDSKRRHILIEQAVLSISRAEEAPDLIESFLEEGPLTSEDLFWLLEKLKASSHEDIQKVWAELIKSSFNGQDVKQINAIIEATQTNAILQGIFEPYFSPINLDPAQADKLRADQLRMQEIQGRRQKHPLLDPPLKEQVFELLDKLEGEDLSAWWQLNMVMTLTPESQYYDNQFELDLTQLPGWQEADRATQISVIEGAKKYIQQQENVNYGSIGTSIFNQLALADYRAFILLLQQGKEFLENLPSKIWKRWASFILAATNSYQHAAPYSELVKHAYQKAPDELIKMLNTLIEKENQEVGHLYVINLLDKCWDQKLKLTLLDKVKDPSLKPECVGQLLEELLQQGLDEAGDFAKSLITSPLPSSENEREKALIAARVLVGNSSLSSWSFIWALVQEDPSFGRSVFGRVADHYFGGIQLDLTEEQLANLYMWLLHQYPYAGDRDRNDKVMGYTVTTRDSIARLRDDVLSQLKERGTPEACAKIEVLIQKLPDITLLSKVLIDAQTNMRRKTWQPLLPEQFLRLVIRQEPSSSELSNQIDAIDQRTKKMENEPKVENTINIMNSPNSPINAPVGTSGITNSNVRIANSDTRKGVHWGNWFAVIGILVAIVAIPLTMSVSGAFNEEFKEWFNHIIYKDEQQPGPKNE